MAVYSLTNLHVATNELNMSCFANQIDVNAESDELDVTTFCGGGYRQKITGLGSFNVNVVGFQDYVAPSPGISFPGTTKTVDGALSTWTVAPEGATVGNVAYFGQSRVMSITDLSGSVGDVAAFNMNMAGTNRLVRGLVGHPVAARTATGTGDIFAFTPPTATQSLHMAVHVHSVTGAGTLAVFVATDDGVGFGSPVTRITSASFADVGHEFKSLAGALTGETHARIGWTIAGFTSVTFSVAIGAGVA